MFLGSMNRRNVRVMLSHSKFQEVVAPTLKDQPRKLKDTPRRMEVGPTGPKQIPFEYNQETTTPPTTSKTTTTTPTPAPADKASGPTEQLDESGNPDTTQEDVDQKFPKWPDTLNVATLRPQLKKLGGVPWEMREGLIDLMRSLPDIKGNKVRQQRANTFNNMFKTVTWNCTSNFFKDMREKVSLALCASECHVLT